QSRLRRFLCHFLRILPPHRQLYAAEEIVVPKVLIAPTEPGCANGEQFVRLLVANEQALFNYGYTLLLNTDDTHEVLQDAAVAMWQHLDEFGFSRPFFPWAARFVFFHVLSLRKRRRSQKRVFTDKTLEMLAEEHAVR